MTTYQYHSQLQPGAQTSFRETTTTKGHYALASAVGKKTTDLLEQFIPLLEASDPPTEEQFYRYLEGFLTWFRQGYEQKKGEPCPFSDDEITEGIGLFWADTSGRAILISVGNFQFSYLNNKLLNPIQQGFQTLTLPPGAVLIADPNRSEEPLSVSRMYREGGEQWTVLVGQTFVHPVGLVWAEVVTTETSETKVRTYTRPKGLVEALMGAVLVGLLVGLFWANHKGWMDLSKLFSSGTGSTATAADTSRTAPVSNRVSDNTTETSSDTTRIPNDPGTEMGEADTDSPDTSLPGPDGTSSEVRQQQPSDDPDELAESYLETAMNTFEKAESFRANGKPKQARAMYETALDHFKKHLRIIPQSKDALQHPMARCQQFIQLYDSQEAF